MTYDIIFFWVGILSTILFGLLGMSVFSIYVLDALWKRFKDGKDLAIMLGLWKDYENHKKSSNDSKDK